MAEARAGVSGGGVGGGGEGDGTARVVTRSLATATLMNNGLSQDDRGTAGAVHLTIITPDLGL